MPFQIVRNDITKVKADAIVNTANPKPVVGSGTDRAIYDAAGKEALLSERKKIGEIERGQAVATPAFNLQAKYIIHTVGPSWKGGEDGEYDILKACYENSLKLATELKCRSVAFPLIATGVYGFPKDKALQTAMSVIQPFVMEHDMKVILVVFDKKSFELSGTVVENVREFVDANYVGNAAEAEYGITGGEEELDFSREEYYRRRYEETGAVTYGNFPVEASGADESHSWTEQYKTGKVDIKKLISTPEKTFHEKLFEIIDERGLSGPEVYKNYISKQVFSKIQGDKNYHPNKFTAIALCLSLHLDIDETRDLLGRAGWALSPSSIPDLVVAGCIKNGEFNLVNINIMLFDFNCPELEKIK